jgi:hypothetical protein
MERALGSAAAKSAAGDGTGGETAAAFESLGAALDSERAAQALATLLSLHRALMSRIFGALADEPDFPRAAGRVDFRLGAWAWIAREASRLEGDPAPGFDDRTRLLIALLGMYYLGSAQEMR